ncbi:MAG: MmgE/PrpD family protein, partial [Moorella sp. (in: Bacteria)]|nr:MmgE/PrpD family protein [Moorella sp. (in: firmicutes)]
EMDDVSNEASLHPGVAVFPAALSAAQVNGCSGKDFLAAVVLGYEVMVRLGKALGPAKHYAQGFHPTGTCGVFGAVAAAGKIMDLSEEQLVSAFGIAGSQAAASMEFLSDGTWTKRLHPGWAAHSGLLAVFLAKKGFKGPSSILEGKSGFLRAYSPDPDYAKVTENLGQSYAIMRT